MAMHEEVGFSINAHIPETSILRHFPKDSRGIARKALKELCKMGLIVKHPTSGSMTYSLTKEGIRRLKEVFEKIKHQKSRNLSGTLF
jgi:ribosomal protein S19E (S16A)